MPGIMGILTKHVVGDEESRLATMIRSMQYEPFYNHGSFCDKSRGIFIGYTTLQGSFSDCMPIYNETKDMVLFLTGEVFFDPGLILSLQRSGHKFNPADASYLIHLFEEDEKHFFKTLNGSFNGIVLDLLGNHAILFNDRYGVRRLYCSETESGLVFSAEAKALLKAYPPLRELNNKSIGEYFVYDCVLENRTYFNKIEILPPGSTWHYANGKITKTKYHDQTALENKPQLSQEDFTESFIDTFKRVLPRYFMGKTLGLGLTGGLDTRTIIAAFNPPPGQLPCYTFGMKNPKFRDIYDLRLAPLVAEACKQPYSILNINEDQFLRTYPDNVEKMLYISDGEGSVVNTAKLLHHRMARQISQVWMSGKYGTEVLKNGRGLKRETAPNAGLINKDYQNFLIEARKTRSMLPPSSEFSFYLNSDLPWWWHKYIAIESSQVEVRSPFLDNEIIDLVYQAPSMTTTSRENIQLQLIGRYHPALLKIPSTSGHHEGTSISRRIILRYLSIADKFYIREQLPHGLTHKYGRLDTLLKPFHLERLLVGSTNSQRYRAWFRDQLSQYLMDILLSSRTYSRPYWNKGSLEKILTDHIRGKGTYLLEIRKVLQMELINRTFID